jgi:hypothetical protein
MSWEPSARFKEWPGCRACAYWAAARCIAFPDGIPFPIVAGQVDHLVPRPGQVGTTVFTPMDVAHWQRTRQRVPARAATAETPG